MLSVTICFSKTVAVLITNYSILNTMPKIITLADINRARRQQQPSHFSNEIKTYQSSSDVRASYYQLPQWKALRSEYRRLHPLDELSLLSGRVEAAADVHHLISPFGSGYSQTQTLSLLLDADNLISLTKQHHGYIHGNTSALTDEEKEYLNERTEAVRKKHQFA